MVALLNVADRIIDLYPEIDRDLLLTGIFLHDIGKVDELSYDRAFAYTDEGQLVGHLVMGVEMLRDKVERTAELTGEPFPTELLLRLKHMIVSHHGAYEFGSPKLPMTLEAVALHYLDNLDAKIHAFSREIRDDPSRDSSWTPFQQSLGRRLYKGAPQRGGRRQRRAMTPSEVRPVVRRRDRTSRVTRSGEKTLERAPVQPGRPDGHRGRDRTRLRWAGLGLDLLDVGGRDRHAWAFCLALSSAPSCSAAAEQAFLPGFRPLRHHLPAAGRLGLVRRPARPRPYRRAERCRGIDHPRSPGCDRHHHFSIPFSLTPSLGRGGLDGDLRGPLGQDRQLRADWPDDAGTSLRPGRWHGRPASLQPAARSGTDAVKECSTS